MDKEGFGPSHSISPAFPAYRYQFDQAAKSEKIYAKIKLIMKIRKVLSKILYRHLDDMSKKSILISLNGKWR